MPHKYPHEWTLKDATFTKDKGTVFSCFACGGGSTMGYKLAGFDVVGFNEIDPKMADCYINNHSPKYAYVEPIQDFKNREDLPDELFNLDILDGSPPCSSFSMAGNREKDWGKEKHFREGQAKQVLDTLFFDFIDLAKKLKPKVVIAENVKGILLGNAKEYARNILKEFDNAGYYIQYFLLDASKMGVPQRRERVFFIGLRKDLAEPYLRQKDLFTMLPYLDLDFNEPPIYFKDIVRDDYKAQRVLTPQLAKFWPYKRDSDIDFGNITKRVLNKDNYLFSRVFLKLDKVVNTLTSHNMDYICYHQPRVLNDLEIKLASSYPIDYNFTKSTPSYLCGMSVPPVMTAQIATRIYEQWQGIFKQNK